MSAGSLEVISGGMFSGKSEELLRRVRRAVIARQTVLVVRPDVSREGGAVVRSRDGQEQEAVIVGTGEAGQLPHLARQRGARVVAVDEAQFFAAGLVGAVAQLVADGRRVILAGLDMDFAGRPFGAMPQLMAMADEVTKLKAVCMVCGGPAAMTQRLVDGRPATLAQPVVAIEGEVSYEARCRDCWVPPGGGRPGA